jgi:predicted ATPase
MHDFAGELIASAGSSSASIVTPPNFHFVSLNQGVVPLVQGGNLRCRFTAQANNARWYEAEVHRLRGHLLRRMGQPDPRQIEDCFQTAVAVARGQDATWWELRAATELAEIWLEQGKHRAARDLLDPIYDWFTEGFDTPDLTDTRRLLDRLHGGQAD